MVGDLMDCIYLNCMKGKCYCHAAPLRPNEVVVFYEPTEEELKELCKNRVSFNKCPRFEAFRDTFKTEYG
jgi:hypothetical protein